MSVEAVTTAKTQRHHARSIGGMVINILAALFFSILASAAVVLAADYFLFRSAMWMETEPPKWIRGSMVASPTEHAWHVGVELPGGMAFERIYIGAPGSAPQHPALGGWDFRILPIGLALNSLIVAGPLFVLVTVLAWTTARTFRRIKASIRRARGQCEVCAYVLIAGQNPCPECGHHRKAIEYKAANCGN